MIARLAVVAAIAVGAAGCGGSDRQLVGMTRDPEPQVDAVALPDVANGGQPFDFRAAPDALLVVYFGYTNCPDICPTTMSDLRVALGELGDQAERVDVAMVTVDPERDTDVLADYVQGFVPDGHAIARSGTAPTSSSSTTLARSCSPGRSGRPPTSSPAISSSCSTTPDHVSS